MASGRICRSSNRAELTAPQYHHNVGRLTSDVTHRRTIDARPAPPHAISRYDGAALRLLAPPVAILTSDRIVLLISTGATEAWTRPTI